MQRHDSLPSLWFFLPPETEPSRALQRSNLIAIAILVLLTIGLLLAGFVPAPTSASGSVLAIGHAQPRVGATPPAHHIR